jgi:hypothetical protein
MQDFNDLEKAMLRGLAVVAGASIFMGVVWVVVVVTLVGWL